MLRKQLRSHRQCLQHTNSSYSLLGFINSKTKKEQVYPCPFFLFTSSNLRTTILNKIKPINVPYFPVSKCVSGAIKYSIMNIIIAIETNIRFI